MSQKTLASKERMGRSERTGVGAKCGGGQLQGAYEITEPEPLCSIRPASWKRKSTQGCLKRANERKWQKIRRG